MAQSEYEPGMEPWVIQKGSAFYRDNFCGYTNHIEAAGLYTRAEAEREAAVEPERMSAYPLSKFRAEIQRDFDVAKSRLELLESNTGGGT